MKEILAWFPVVSWTLIAIGAAIDLYSLALDARRAWKGAGPSGIPMVSLLLFYLPASQMRSKVSGDGLKWLAILGAFYFACHFLIPVVIARAARRADPR